MIKKLCCAVLVLSMLLCAAGADELGCFRADTFQGGAMGIEFIDIVIDDGADILSVWANDTVSDVVLDEVIAENGSCYTRTIFTKDSLASNQVLNMTAYLGEAVPRFRVTCKNASGALERVYITQSGENGEMMLMSAETFEEILPVEAKGLKDTEAESRSLTQALQEDHSQQELNELAGQLCELWENQRITLWGGYAQSLDEQAWCEKTVQKAQADCEMYQDGSIYPMMYLTGIAMYTRAHVYALSGISMP